MSLRELTDFLLSGDQALGLPRRKINQPTHADLVAARGPRGRGGAFSAFDRPAARRRHRGERG